MGEAFNDDLDAMIRMLPVDVRDVLLAHPNRSNLLEVVLDLGRCPTARFGGGAPNECLRSAPVTREDLDAAEAAVGDFGGDNRAGIEGTLHRISAIRNRCGTIVGLTCRVGRAVRGHVDMIADLLASESGESILFLGRPGVGKTTVIREMARVLSDELGKRVVIIDTSNEIGGDGDVPHPAIGGARRMQVPDPSEQHRVMIEAVENHMPQVVIVDEIGTEAEALACRTIAERGVTLVGTAHGQLLENLIKNPTLSDLVGGVQTVTLGDDEARARGCQKTIMERQAPPTFPILVEMHERNTWIAHDVEESVDEVLAGTRPIVQTRARDEVTGEVTVERCLYEADERLGGGAVARTLGSMGGVMAATASMDDTFGFNTGGPLNGSGDYYGDAADRFAKTSSSPGGGGGYPDGRGGLKPSRADRAAREAAFAGGDHRGAANNAVASSRGNAARGGGGVSDNAPNNHPEDPYAWANSLGMVPDKDALEAMGAGDYIPGGRLGGRDNGNGGKRGNGTREKKARAPRAVGRGGGGRY